MKLACRDDMAGELQNSSVQLCTAPCSSIQYSTVQACSSPYSIIVCRSDLCAWINSPTATYSTSLLAETEHQLLFHLRMMNQHTK